MNPKRLSDKNSRMMARRERDSQWAFMERVAREGIVWMCPWDKYHKHGRRCVNEWCHANIRDGEKQCPQCKTVMDRVPDDGVYVFGLIGSNEFIDWLNAHRNWWKRGRWSEKRCARSIRLTDTGRKALKNRHRYDMEDISGGMVEPGYIVRPWPRKKEAA